MTQTTNSAVEDWKEFRTERGRSITYDEIRRLSPGNYTMSLVGGDLELVQEAVNKGIDSRLEACFCPDRGDSYKLVARKPIGPMALECVVSSESLPVLLRRCVEIIESRWGTDSDADDEAALLVDDILDTLENKED